MELVQFYFRIALLSEFSLIVPIVIGFFKWSKFDQGLKLILVFLLVEFFINCVSFYYSHILQRNNLFLFYYYSWFWNIFILRYLMLLISCKNVIWGWMIVGGGLIVTEYLYFGIPHEMNYLSGLFVNVVILILSLYIFSITFAKENTSDSSSTTLLILLGLMVQFFARSGDIFIKKYLFQTNFYAVFWYYESIVYYYIMLVVTCIYSYAFYLFKKYE